jgi:hypothetical protein
LIDEYDIADLSTFDRYESCGINPRVAVAEYDESQQLADDLRAAGYRGVLSVSAALVDSINLTLFDVRYENPIAGDLAGWSNPDAGVWLAVQLAAERAGPPVQLCTETSFRDAPHLGYRAWLASKGYPLPPDPP